MITVVFDLIFAFFVFGWSQVSHDLMAKGLKRPLWTNDPTPQAKFLVWVTWWYRPILDRKMASMGVPISSGWVALSLFGSTIQLFLLAFAFWCIGKGVFWVLHMLL